MYEGKTHTLFAKYAIPQMIGLLFNSVYMIVMASLSATGWAPMPWRLRPYPFRSLRSSLRCLWRLPPAQVS